MNIAIILPIPDFAGPNIQKHLLEKFPFQTLKDTFENKTVYELKNEFHIIRLFSTDTWCVLCEHIDNQIKQETQFVPDLLIFATTHRSEKGVPSFCVHPCGNWGEETKLGGKPKNLAPANAPMMRHLIQHIKQACTLHHIDGHQITMEATHHGPELNTPVIFVEIGSEEKHWKDPNYGAMMADALMAALATPVPNYKVAVGLGGPHYVPNFMAVMEKSDLAFGHLCPKHHLTNLDVEMLKQAITKSSPNPAELVVIDWKGVGGFKDQLITMLDELKIPYKKVKEFE